MEGLEFNKYVGGLVNKHTKEPVIVMGKEKDLEVIGNLENMRKVRTNLKVLARSRPNDKYVMVAGLR